MKHVRKVMKVSERRACRVLAQPRSTQRYESVKPEGDEALVLAMDKLRKKHKRYGFRGIWGRLKRSGWRVNRKRVHRIWKAEGWQVPRKRRKRRGTGSSANSCAVLRAERRGHVWTYDFVMDRTERGGQLGVPARSGRVHARSPCGGSRPELHGPGGGGRSQAAFPEARGARVHPIRQWLGVRGQSGPGGAEGSRSKDAFHRTRKPLGERLQRVIQQGPFTVACWRTMWKPDREIQTPTSPGGGRGPKWSQPVWCLSAPVGRIVKPLIHEGRCDRLAVLLGSTPVQDLGTPRCQDYTGDFVDDGTSLLNSQTELCSPGS